MAEITEAAVAGRARPSDAELYVALAPELIRFAASLIGRGDAADVLSAAVVRSLASPTWPTVADRRAYLYRAVFTESCTWRRRSRQRREREARTWTPDRVDLPNVRPDVVRAVAGLSVRQKAVIVLTYWLDLHPAEIAQLLGISDGSVRRHLARARARLRGGDP